MGPTIERTDSSDAFRRLAEVTLAALLHDVGKVFQRADWPLSQTAEKLQDELCPIVEGRPVHRHVLWTYDFCNDNLKWLADFLDLARVIRLATGHHRAAHDDPAALILDAADRVAAGAEAVEIEELQPAIPPQVPLESILWAVGGRLAPAEPVHPKSRRVRRQVTEAPAAQEPEARPMAEGQMPEQAPAEGTTGEAVPAPEIAPVEPSGEAPGGEAPGPAAPMAAEEPAVPFVPQRVGYIKAQLFRSDEDVLPGARRPEMNEQDYRALATDLVAAVQTIGRMTVKPRLEWLVEALRGALEQRCSLVPAYVGSGGRTVSLYSHAAAMAAVATVLWQQYERTGRLAASPADKPLCLVAVQLENLDAYLSRPAATENSARVYRGRAALARLTLRLLGDVLLRELALPSVSRLWETDDAFVVLAGADEATAETIRRFAVEQGRRLFAQTAGWLRLSVSKPEPLSVEQVSGSGWAEAVRGVEADLAMIRARPGIDLLQDERGWREDAAVLTLTDRHGQVQPPGEWARLQEAYERQLGSSLAGGKTLAAYNSPVTPAGSEGEPTAIGPWFVHVGPSPEGLVGWEGLEQVYALGEPAEPWAWVPAWHGLPHGPTFRRADESQLRADPAPQQWLMTAAPRRRETPIGFDELGWLARRSRKGRGFVGRSWLGCLSLQADALDSWAALASQAENLGQAIEITRQGQWFWQDYLEGQLRRADRATWRVFVLRCGLGRAMLLGPWNTIMVLAGRAEQWWRRFVGGPAAWPVRGALVFAPRDMPAWQLVWQGQEGLLAASPAEGMGRLWLFDRPRTWSTYREALRLATLLDEQVQAPEMLAGDAGLTFLRRLVLHERQAQQAARAGKGVATGVAWRAGLAQDLRRLLLENLPRRGKRTAAQDELIQQLQGLIASGRRSRLPGSIGLAARVALWQNQGETS